MDDWREWRNYPRSTPRAAQGGIRAQSQRGGFGASWWAKRWIAALEGFNLGARLQRGRSYARKGQVASIAIEAGAVSARVQGSRPQPYDVRIKVKPLSKGDWQKLAGVVSSQAIYGAKLLGGEMPQDIEAAFQAAGLSLFPRRYDDLTTNCSCPDWSNPCKHIAAVYYLLGEEFDRDPFLIFQLRGMSRGEFLGVLGESAPKGEVTTEEVLPPEPLPVSPFVFWNGAALPDHLIGDVSLAPAGAALPRRLGKFPFWRGRENLLDVLEPIYAAAASRAAQTLGEAAFAPTPRIEVGPFSYLQILRGRVTDGVRRFTPFRPTVHYLSRTEVHAFGFAIAASVLLSLFPLLNVMASIALYVFKWKAAVQAIQSFIKDYFPGELGDILASYFYNPNKIEFVSIILLLFTANGIFEPLEVALNRAWGVTTDRSYVKNQFLSFLLILLCGGLVLASFLLITVNREYMGKHFGTDGLVVRWVTVAIVRLIGVPMIVLALFLTYWLLPNCRVPVSRIVPAACYAGGALTVLQYIAILAWKWIIGKLRHDYGPFAHSSSVILFSFVAAMIVLAGAEWSARSPDLKTTEPPIMSAEPADAKPVE